METGSPVPDGPPALAAPHDFCASTRADPVQVTRIGTQVVVRLSGSVGENLRGRLHEAIGEVDRLVVRRVVVDLDDVVELHAAGVDFVIALQQRWPVRLLNAPDGLRRGLLARPAV
ncbi:MAG: hypothetical protein U0Q15_06125 [Kineosporiaceae bacterium]